MLISSILNDASKTSFEKVNKFIYSKLKKKAVKIRYYYSKKNSEMFQDKRK